MRAMAIDARLPRARDAGGARGCRDEEIVGVPPLGARPTPGLSSSSRRPRPSILTSATRYGSPWRSRTRPIRIRPLRSARRRGAGTAATLLAIAGDEGDAQLVKARLMRHTGDRERMMDRRGVGDRALIAPREHGRRLSATRCGRARSHHRREL
jgi:hypothetical protein